MSVVSCGSSDSSSLYDESLGSRTYLQSQLRCFISVPRGLSSSSKLAPAHSHDNCQSFKREKSMEGLLKRGRPNQAQHHFHHSLLPRASYKEAQIQEVEKQAPLLMCRAIKAHSSGANTCGRLRIVSIFAIYCKLISHSYDITIIFTCHLC